MDPGIVIDPDIAGLLVPHAPHELALLETSLLADGCRDPLVVWAGRRVLLDGHARLDICRRHALPFAATEVDLPDRDAAVAWMLNRALARRNMRPIAVSYYRGVLHRLTVAPPGTRVDLDPGQGVRGAADLAHEFGVDARTLRRDANLAADLDAVAESLGDDFRRSVLSGVAKLTRVEIAALAAMTVVEQKRFARTAGRRRSKPKPPKPPTLDLAARLADLWRLAGRDDRRRFVELVGVDEVLGELKVTTKRRVK